MKKKRKLGRKLLSFLLTLAMVVGLVPGIGMTAYAADIPYASLKNTTNIITFDNKQWYLIDYDESTVTLLTKECVAASQYNSNGTSNTYSGSTVETTVNNYYTNSISDAVKSAVVDNKMFLLTTAQVTAMTEETRKCSQASGAYNAWWLCSPTFYGYASCVNCDNGSVDDSYGYNVADTLGVRPALKLDLSKVTFDSDTNTFTVGSAQTPTETLLTTITPTSQTTYDQSVDGVVEVTLSVYNYYNGEWSWGENDEGSVMVEGKEGYTITKCEFICNSLTFTDTEAPFKINKSSGTEYIDEGTGMDGVTSIKVYGYATSPTETLLTGISLDKTTAQAIDVEGTVSFTATVTPDNATDKTVKWSVGGTNMYAVKLYSDANCTAGNEIGTDATSTLTVYAKGIRAGSATVTCTSIADSTKSASCDVMVVRERIGDIGDFYEGDILGYYWREMNASATDYEVTLQSGGYYIVDEGVGNTDYVLESDEWYYKDDDYTDNLNTLCLWDNDYEYKPYCNGHIAEYWIVVSASGEYGNKKVTLTGYDPGQNNNPFTEDVIYRRYSTDGKPLEDGTLSANVGIKVESDTRTWYNGKTYVVSDDVTISDRIKVIGTVNLILLDGAKLTAQKGISVNAKYGYSKTLNIYAGSTSDTILGTGQLIADAKNCEWDWDCAGIGGDDYKAGGVLNIYGGVITAYGNEHGAGIGGGEWNYHNDITIYGGTISAYGGSDDWDDGGAGIGAGVYGGYEDVKGNVKIYGGDVTAVGGKNSAGIGGGAEAYRGGDNVYIYGGTVVATGAAGKEGIGKGTGEGGSGNLTLGCVKLETSTDNENWTEVTDTNSRTQYMKITPVPHDLTDYPAVAATCTTSGNSAYWKCNRCGKYFSDAEGVNEIAENSWVIPATGHNLSYSANNNTIIATCSNSGCDYEATLTIVKPTLETYGQTGEGISEEATISGGIEGLENIPIIYKKEGEELTAAPTNAGTYTANIILADAPLTGGGTGTVTASVEYQINKGSVGTPAVTMTGYTYGGTVSTPGIETFSGNGGVTYYYNTTDSNTGGTKWENITSTSLNAGTYYMYAVVDATDNYDSYTTLATSFTVSPASVTLTANGGTETYDGTEKTVTGFTSGVNGLDFDSVSASGKGTNAGSYYVTFSGVTVGETKDTTGNYIVTELINGTLTINPAGVTLSANSGSETYNGSEQTLTGFTSSVEGLTFTGVSASGGGTTVDDYDVTFSGVTVGETKDTTGNYVVKETTNGLFKIIPKPVTIVGVTVEDRVYNCTNGVDFGGDITVSGVCGEDVVQVDTEYALAILDSKNAGTNKSVTFCGFALKGEDSGNYELSAQPADATVNIAPKAVTITGVTAGDKEYDGTDDVTEIITTDMVIDGGFTTDDVSISVGEASFDSANVGNDRQVSFTGFSLVGSDAYNYSLESQPNSVNAAITPKAVTVTAADQCVDVGDSIDTSLSQAQLEDAISGHSLSSVDFTSTSTASITTEGTITPKDACIKDSSNNDVTANYAISYVPGTLTVNVFNVYISGVSASGKTYDGTKDASITGTAVLKRVKDDSVVTSITVSDITGEYEDKNVGANKSVSITGATLSDDTNYVLNVSKTNEKLGLKADIDKKEAAIDWSDTEFDYDGDEHVPTAEVSNLVAGDSCVVTVTGGKIDAGDDYVATATALSDSNYVLPTTGLTKNFSIKKVDIPEDKITEPTENTDLVFSGSDMDLITAGSVEAGFGEMYYAVTGNDTAPDEDAFSNAIPTAKDVGTYYVWYYAGDDNHNMTEPQCIEVTVSPKEVSSLTIVVNPDTFTYDGSGKKPTVAVKDGATVISPDEYTVTYSNNTDVGTAKITITDKDGGNYIINGSGTFTIESADTSDLEDTIEEAEKLYDSIKGNPDYASITEALKEAIDDAKGVAEKKQLSEADVSAAVEALQAAIEQAKKDIAAVDDANKNKETENDGDTPANIDPSEVTPAMDEDEIDTNPSKEDREQESPDEDDTDSDADPTDNPSKYTDDSSKNIKKDYHSEWVGGLWYAADGTQTYKPIGHWEQDSTGWYYIDEEKWYPTNMWQKIDGYWYFFDEDGYMVTNQYCGSWNPYIRGCWWVGADGRWDGSAVATWRLSGSTTWFGDTDGWYAKSGWLKIKGIWYYFDSEGCLLTNQYIGEYWVNGDGAWTP